MDTTVVSYSAVQSEEIGRFIEEQWGRGSGCICHETSSEYVHTDIMSIGGDDEDRVMVTLGTGAREMDSPLPEFTRIELVMYATAGISGGADGGPQAREMVAWSELLSLSKYPFRNDTWLGYGHTINASKRFTEEFGYPYFILGEHPESAHLSGIGEIHFLIVIPIYAEERDWIVRREDGSQRFLSRYVEEFLNDERQDDLFMIDLPRQIVIPAGP